MTECRSIRSRCTGCITDGLLPAYYVELVEQYAEFDEISSPGDDILDAKKEIEKTLDMINQAFVTLLNNLFRDAAFDASAECTGIADDVG